MRLIDTDEVVARIDEKLNEIPTFTESEYGILGYRNACVAFKRMLDNIPTADGWIPMSERPPEVGQYVLISIRSLMGMNYVATATFQGDYWESIFDLDWEEVLAWMSLPEPYGERKRMKEWICREILTTTTDVKNGILMRETELIRCKDCKHRPTINGEYEDGFDLEFPTNRCPCQCDDGWYNWMPKDDWYCANGERKEE